MSLCTVVVHELSRLLTARWGEIHDFIQHALEHDTSVRDLEVGLSSTSTIAWLTRQ